MSAAYNVLLVGHETLELGATGAILSEHFQLRLATSSAAALALLDRQPFDALCTDLILPDRTGLQLLRSASKMQPSLAGVLIAYSRKYREYCGAWERQLLFSLVLKPFPPGELTATVLRAITLARLKRTLACVRPEPSNKQHVKAQERLALASRPLEQLA